MEVILLPPKDIFGGPIRSRINPFIDKLQVLSGDVLRMLKTVFRDAIYDFILEEISYETDGL